MTFDLAKAIAPLATDKTYTKKDMGVISLILRADSYKFSHHQGYPTTARGMACYGTARVDQKQVIVPFGMQILLKRYLTQRITMEDIDKAEAFALAHFGRKLFARDAWELVVTKYDGYLPLIIRNVPEGTKIRGGDPIYSVFCLDDNLFWMAAYFETLILRGIWYPTTIATMDHEIKKAIKHYYELTGSDMSLLMFSLHDFGGRGVTCAEQAEIGGAAHTVSFMGSDTDEGIITANEIYSEAMSAYSVAATEHSIECSFGLDEEGEKAYLRHILTNVAVRGSIVSIVIDGRDVYRCAKFLCTEFRDMIIASGCKVVFRPDSGDMMEVVPRLLRMMEVAFGYTMTTQGYKVIKYVGIIQGDGVDHLAITSLLGKMLVLGYAAQNVLFGSGGALLQKVNRDTFKFAQKASAVLMEIDGVREWIGVSKDPITDPGKKSLEGILTLGKNVATGEYVIARLDRGEINESVTDVMQLSYHTGTLYNETTLAEVRSRVEA